MRVLRISSAEIVRSTAAGASGTTFNDALILAKVWCLQQGFLHEHDMLNVPELALLLAYLYRTRRAGTRMGPVQVLTVLLKYLTETDWLGDGSGTDSGGGGGGGSGGGSDTICHSASEGYRAAAAAELLAGGAAGGRSRVRRKVAIIMPEQGAMESQTAWCPQARLYEANVRERGGGSGGGGLGEPDAVAPLPSMLLECYKAHIEGPVFLDLTMTANSLSCLLPSFVQELRSEAAGAVRWLHRHANKDGGGGGGGAGGSPFRVLFLEHCHFFRRYDAYVRVDRGSVRFPTAGGDDGDGGGGNTKGGRAPPPPLWGDDVGWYESLSRGLVRVLSTALGDHISAVRALTTGNGETDLLPAAEAAVDSDLSHRFLIQGTAREASDVASGEILSPLCLLMMTSSGGGDSGMELQELPTKFVARADLPPDAFN